MADDPNSKKAPEVIIPTSATPGTAANPTPPTLSGAWSGGRVSAKVGIGRTYKRSIRIEQAARLASTGMYTNIQIAAHMGINVQTLVYLKNTPEFQSKLIELATGVISQFDKDLREDILNNGRDELRGMVPIALQGLRTALVSKNEQIKMRAIEQVLDREGTLSRVSRTSVSLETKPDLTQANSVGSDLLSLLQNAVPVSGMDKQAPNFTMTAAQASAQATAMRDTIDNKTLEEIDLAGKPVN